MRAPTRPRWLRDVNGEAFAVPGLRFWGNRLGETFSIIAQDERGAAELWHDEAQDDGGIELHSPRDWGRFSGAQPCTILGAECWSDGSLLAWTKQFAPLLRESRDRDLLALLADWHRDHFGGDF